MADAAMVAQVRRFNRTVTMRAGALEQRFLGLDLTLGESRLLWEIGEAGCELRTLRARLQLDSGYLSRVLRTLEARGYATVEPSPSDRRVRVARLTRKGLSERRTLDRRSDSSAAAILAPLDEVTRERLVTAMREVERLLVAAEVELVAVDPASDVARWCIEEYFAELSRRSGGRFDRSAAISAEPHELVPPHGRQLVAFLHGEPAGTGVVKHHPGAPSEIKRMWIAPAARGIGLGRRLLLELEELVRQSGARVAHIETNAALTEAIALYKSAGWTEVPPFNEEPFADFWF